jgi:hypothetical protein
MRTLPGNLGETEAIKERKSLCMRSLRLFSLFFVTFLLPGWAASINVSTLCDPLPTSPSLQPNSPGSSVCNSFSGNNGASAGASATFSLAPDGFAFSLSTSAISNTLSAGDASATASITAFLETAGPLRAGYVSITCPYLACAVTDGGAAGGSFAFSIGSIAGGSCGPTNCANPPLESIELGETLQFTAAAIASATSGGLATGSGEGDGVANASYTVEFFEANGVTPVALSETPEPGSAAVMGGGLVWLGWLARRRLLGVKTR